MQIWVYTLVSVIITSLISLIGVFTLSLNPEKVNRMIIYMVSFAVGGLFGDAFIHILPEAFEKLGINSDVELTLMAMRLGMIEGSKTDTV